MAQPTEMCTAPIQTGDTRIVRSASYTSSGEGGLVVYASKSSPTGTASHPITIKSEVRQGARIIIPSTKKGLNGGFYLTRLTTSSKNSISAEEPTMVTPSILPESNLYHQKPAGLLDGTPSTTLVAQSAPILPMGYLV